ncbi:peptidylprolyl isomerase [Lutibacter sp.]|uniref:peptidylprolyl isomerase n=1 Tax=Lutibacter sp. TaxID=1925666 RepID=UPI0035695F32
MAILSKIRDRSMFLILIVGLALFAFVLDPSSIQSFFSSNKVNAIGQVNGEDIDREEFAQQVEAYRTQSGGRATQMQAVNAVWDAMVSEKMFAAQLEKAGIVVGEKDIWDAMVSLPEVQNSPMFRNEANLFDEEMLKEYIANLKDESVAGNSEAWMNWLNTEKSIKQNLERQAYTTLVSAGLGASFAEGKREYLYQNTKMDAQYVYLPYTSINESSITVSKGEMKAYLEKNAKRFKSEASRSLEYVKFDIVASESDENDVKTLVESYINDREEYSTAAKAKVVIPGLKTATHYESFMNDNKSDSPMSETYIYKNQLPITISEEIFSAAINDVVGPYKENGSYKISKVLEVTKIADSVKSSHIIIPFAGATRSTSLKTKEEAKQMADSIYALVKGNKTKFAEIADEINSDGTKGKGGDIGWIRKDQAFSQSFDPDFASFIYKNNAGTMGVVETAFGYHVISVDEQKNIDQAVKLATFSRLIEPSEETENLIFEKAETLASKLAEGGSLEDIAKENNYSVLSAMNLKSLDENLPGISNQRSIVTWAFENGRELGDSKRFDFDVNGNRGYLVAVLKGKAEKDSNELTTDIISQIRPEIVNSKKAAILKEKMKGATLEEVAKNANTTVASASLVTLASPLISGVGNEPKVVGAMSTIKLNEVSNLIEGDKGVFMIKVTNRTEPVKLDNYENFRKQVSTKLSGRSYQLFQVLKEKSDVVDNRAKFF